MLSALSFVRFGRMNVLASLLAFPSILYTCLFFFHPHRAPRDLHSFPTRRSSDLFSAAGSSGWLCTECFYSRCSPFCAERCDRSEEHTSELQSPCNLVCRLLLEQKNLGYNLATGRMWASLGDFLLELIMVLATVCACCPLSLSSGSDA